FVRRSWYNFTMSIDVVDLRDFYSNRLGAVARHFVGRGVRKRWADTRGLRVLGIGYATPYLGLFREEAERTLAFMPAAQGVVKWPTAKPALSALVDDLELPLPDAAVDHVLLVHALEMSNDPTRRHHGGAVRRRAYRRGHQAGLSRDSGQACEAASGAGARTGAGAVARRRGKAIAIDREGRT